MASVSKLPSGKWRGYASYKDETGKRRLKSFIDADRGTALRAARAFEDEMRGVPGRTVGKAIDEYIASKSPILSPSTMRGYISMSRNLKARYAPFLGLIQPSQQQAQAFANALAAEMKPKAVKNYVGLVSSAVRFSGGTFPQVSLPRWELHSDFVPSEDAMRQIMAEVAGTRLEIPVALGMLGLRRSEVCGLSAEDLDGNTLHVHAAAVYGSDNQIHHKGTKTAGSERWISLPEPLADKIRAEGMPELSLHALSAAFRRVVKRLHLEPFRFHDLRHFFVSYCHNVLHLSDAQIMKLGGYTTDSVMKRHYRQSMDDKKSADLVASALCNTICNTFSEKPHK